MTRTQANTGVPKLVDLETAAGHVGASTPEALRMRFFRGTYPKRFLFKVSPRRLAVDVSGLVNWIRCGMPEEEPA